MGLILGAMAGGAEAGSHAIGVAQDQANKVAFAQTTNDLEMQKAKWIADYNTQLAINHQNLMKGIMTPTTGDIQGIIASNAQGPNGSDYTTPTDTTPATYDQLQTEDQNNPNFKPTQRQLYDMQQAKLLNAGFINEAGEINKINDTGKVSAPFGSVIIDQNDIDPTTGKPRVLISNDPEAKSAYYNGRGDYFENGGRSGGVSSPVLASLNKSIQSKTTELRSAQMGLDNARSADRPAFQSTMQRVQGELNALQDAADKERQRIGGVSSAVPAPAPGAAAPPPGGVQVGTSGGKPVYQLQDGSQVIAQ